MTYSDPKALYLLNKYLENSLHCVHSLDPKLRRATQAERAQAALTTRKIRAESNAKSRWKRAIKHQSPKMQNYIYSPGDKVLIWREKIVNNRIGEFIGPFTLLHHDDRSKTVAIDQDGVIKRYYASQIITFLEQPSMLDDSITER